MSKAPIDMEVVEICGKETPSAETSVKRSFPSIIDEEFVGFEKDAENIMKQLIGGTKELDIISIFGMPGLGKTTLARKVYSNPSIVNHFDVKAWCAVSQVYNRRTLLVEIFKQATNDKEEIKENVNIADKLQKTLKGKRYLIVLDDIWKVEAWEDLGLCFPKGNYGSRVMVTTRIEQVAKHLQHRSDPYPLRFLTVDESWELLQKKVFRGSENCSSDIVEAGLQVSQHCKGLPLVVVLIAGIIAKMEREATSWLEVANDLSSIALGEQSMKVIQSSYDHLEDHLKPCLLYMGSFPEDYEISVPDLIKLWMGEEFILNVDTENMEEASRVCLIDLLDRSLVMVSERKINGDIKSCILHDVVREFCLRKLKEENYMQLTTPYNPYQHLYDNESRLCIYIGDDLVKQLDHSGYRLDKIPMLKSKLETESLEFIAHPIFNTWYRSNPDLHLLVRLRLVRVLDLMNANYLPYSWDTAFQSLTHLRYLAIKVNNFLFEWVSHLRDLQTLKVHFRRVFDLDADGLWKMTKLRHLKIDKFSLLWDDDEVNIEESTEILLENLKTFGHCRLYSNDRFWWAFRSLEELKIHLHSLPDSPLFPIPEVHTRLHSLKIGSINYGPEYISSLSRWSGSYFNFPSNLRNLSIHCIQTTEEILTNIARLQKLESLELWITGNLEECWDVTKFEFPALKYLTLDRVSMKEWKVSEESFPVLEKLVIRECDYFNEIPPSFVDIPTLQLIELFDCIDSLGVSAMNIKREIEETTGCDSLRVLISTTIASGN